MFNELIPVIEKMLENRVPSSEEDTSIHYLKEEFLTAIPGCMLPPLSVKEIVLANLFPDNKKSEGMIKFQNDSSIEITTPIEKWAIAVDAQLDKSVLTSEFLLTAIDSKEFSGLRRIALEIDVTLLQGSVAIHLKNQSGATMVQQNVGERFGDSIGEQKKIILEPVLENFENPLIFQINNLRNEDGISKLVIHGARVIIKDHKILAVGEHLTQEFDQALQREMTR